MKKKKKEEKLTYQQILSLFKETDRKIQETDRILTEKFQETDRKIQETDRILTEKFQETDRKFQETDRKLRQLENLFVGQWGKLVEALVEGKLVQLFNERGILIQRTAQRETSYYNNQEIEIDIVGRNGDSMVAVEVKTTLQVRDVNEFIEKLQMIPKAFPEYRGKKIYGAMAFIHSNENARRYAYKKGLFVIKAVGGSAIILNDKKFRPKNYAR